MLKKYKGKKTYLRNEKGAISIEFLGILPFYFLFFLILWQAVSTGYAVMSTKTAVNEAAKYYAVTGDVNETKLKLQEWIGNTAFLEVQNSEVIHDPYSPSFVVKVEAKHSILFIPKKWRESASIPITEKTTGRLFK